MNGFDVSEWVCDPASFDPFPLTGSIDDELYEKGLYVAAFNGFFDAAEKGDAIAQFKVGYMYYYGQGPAENYESAFEWFMKSALQGFAPAEHKIGFMYEDGEGTERNFEEAVKWYQKAAEHGDEAAKEHLEELK